MPKVTVPQKNLVIDVEIGSQLMQVLLDHDIPVASSCKGDGICSKCVVSLDPTGEHNNLEKTTLTKNKKSLDLRLSCQVNLTEDVTVQTSYW